MTSFISNNCFFHFNYFFNEIISFQNHRLSSHLHIYDITNNKWSEINCNSDDFVMPELAGHSCTIHKDKMVIFGGLGDRLRYSSLKKFFKYSVCDLFSTKFSRNIPV